MGGYGRRFDPPATRRLGSGSPGRSPHASFAVGEERLGRERCREWSPLALFGRPRLSAGWPSPAAAPAVACSWGPRSAPSHSQSAVSPGSTFPTPCDVPPGLLTLGTQVPAQTGPHRTCHSTRSRCPPASGLPDTPHRPTPAPRSRAAAGGLRSRRSRAVVVMLCAKPVSASTPMCSFIPKCHSSPSSPDASPGPARLPDSSSTTALRWGVHDRPFTQPQSLGFQMAALLEQALA